MTRYAFPYTAGGIYTITNTANGRVYVGMAGRFSERWRLHRRSLSLNSHHSGDMQSDWNTYGSEVFRFEIVEVSPARSPFSEDDGYKRERAWIQKMLDAGIHLYNTLDNGPLIAAAWQRRKMAMARANDLTDAGRNDPTE